MTAINTYNIVRRAYSKRTTVEQFVGNWVDATNYALTVQHKLNDGEYDAVPVEYADLRYPGGDNQRDLPIAWL